MTPEESLLENAKLKTEIERLKTGIRNDKYRVSMASSIVNKFYLVKPLIMEMKGSFRFDKWQKINELIFLTDRHKAINETNKINENKPY